MSDLLQMAVDVSIGTETYIQDVQSLCTKLADLGEETLFISVNVSGNQCAYLGSTFGKEYIEKSELIQGFFNFCCDKYTTPELTGSVNNKTNSQQDAVPMENSKDDVTIGVKDRVSDPEAQTKPHDGKEKVDNSETTFDETRKECVECDLDNTKQNSLIDKHTENDKKDDKLSDRLAVSANKQDTVDCKLTDGDKTMDKCTVNDKRHSKLGGELVDKDKIEGANDCKSVKENKISEKTKSENDSQKEERMTRNQVGRKTEKKNAARSKAQDSGKFKQTIQSVEKKVTEVKPKVEKDFHMRTRSGGKVKHLPWLKKKDTITRDNDNDKGKEVQTSRSAMKRKTEIQDQDETPDKVLKVTEKIEDEKIDDEFDKKDVENETDDALAVEAKEPEEGEVDAVDGSDCSGQDEKKTCKLCKELFDNNNVLRKHMAEVHEDGVHTCGECSKVFVSAKYLKQHSLTHSTETFSCNVCSKSFAQQRYLNRHLTEVHKPKQLFCNKCGESFYSLKILREHRSEVHNMQKMYTCDLCPEKEEMDIVDFEAHSKTHEPKFKCEYCDKVCSKAHELKLHVRIHTKEKPHKCKMCDRRFARRTTLCVHACTHRDYKAFQCEICGRCFKIKESLRQHRRVHVRESIFSCDFCDQKFRTFDGRKNHILQFHKDNQDTSRWKIYSCEYCKKDFGSKQQYIRHVSIHTGSRPHECSDCGKRYPTKSALNTHKKIHKETKPFQCKVCNLSFLVFSKMKRHMETQKHLQWCKGYGVDPLGNLHEYEEKMKAETIRDPEMTCGLVVPVGDGPLPPFNRDLAEKVSPPATPLIIKREVGMEESIEAEELVECVLIHIPEGVQDIHTDGQTNIVYSINTEDGTVEEIFEEPAAGISSAVETIFDEKTIENQTIS